ncbi:glycosyl hydrolase family 28-related protein [Paenibacillus sp. 1P07SE]|uniref:glycosyl hydrolase family 28-related protein n=1 Tax=Paenibacillus sp. 1P07SE TaxID=3132209 RepID=UPI0039A584A3
MSVMGINVLDYGADPTNTLDSTQAFHDAMVDCQMRHTLIIPAGTYKITDTILNNAARIQGEGKYIDSGKRGTRIVFSAPINTANDWKPCFLFDKGAHIWVEHLTIHGVVDYNVRNLTTYIDKDLFDQRKIEMFAPGLTGIKIGIGSQVKFNNVMTSKLKCGVQSDNRTGHITWLECDIGGLFGIYVSRPTGDYYYHGGTLKGAFAGCLLGDSGCNWEMMRVHMGFSPYGFFQVNDGRLDRGEVGSRKGMEAWQLRSIKFEVIGECAIDLLPDSLSWESSIEAYGFSWSTLDPSDSWFYGMPDQLVAPADKQKRALRLGIVRDVRFLSQYTTAGIFRYSPGRYRTNGDRIVEVDFLDGDAIFDRIHEDDIQIRTKVAGARIDAGYPRMFSQATSAPFNPIRSGNLVLTGQSEIITTRCVLTPVNRNQLPEGLDVPREVVDLYGQNPPIYLLTPNEGINQNPELSFNFADGGNAIYDRDYLYYRAFAMMPGGITSPTSRIGVDIEGRDLDNNQVRFTRHAYTNFYNSAGTSTSTTMPSWRMLSGNYERINKARYTKMRYIYSEQNAGRPIYIIPPIVTLNALTPYSPYRKPYAVDDVYFPPGKGPVIESQNGSKFRITVSDEGIFSVSPV